MLVNPQQKRILLALGMGISLSLPGDQTLYAVLPTQAGAVGISLGAVGVLLSINRVVRIPGNPIAGRLYDRLGRRPLFLVGLGLGILSTFSYVFAHNLPAWLAGRLLWGVAWSLLNVGGLTMVLDVTGDHDRGKVTGLYQFSYLVGLGFSPVLGGYLTDLLGFRRALLVCAAIAAAGLSITFFALPETRPSRPPVRARTSLSFPALLKQALRRPGLWIKSIRPAGPADPDAPIARAGLAKGPTRDIRQLAVHFTYLMTLFAGNGIVMSTISLYLLQNFGPEILIGGSAFGVASLGGMLLALRSLIAMLAGPAFGHLSDRLRDRWPVVLSGIVIEGVGFGALIVGSQVWTVPLGVALIALSTGMLLTNLAALTGDLAASHEQGRAIGRLATAGDLGSAAGPLLAYAVLALIDLRWVYLLCSLGFVSNFLVVRSAMAHSGNTGRTGCARPTPGSHL
jgi:MFS family permease